jgi:hypothetical protein
MATSVPRGRSASRENVNEKGHRFGWPSSGYTVFPRVAEEGTRTPDTRIMIPKMALVRRLPRSEKPRKSARNLASGDKFDPDIERLLHI